MRICIFTHVFSSYWSYFLNNWFNHLHLNCCWCYWRKTNEYNWYMNALLFIFIIITHNISSTRWVREKDSKSGRMPQSLENLFSSFKCCSRLRNLFVFYKGKFRKDLDFFNYPIIWHKLGHSCLIVMLRDTSKPKLSDQNITRFLAYYFLWAWNRIVGL